MIAGVLVPGIGYTTQAPLLSFAEVVWLTPLVTLDPVVEAIRDNPAALLIGGTADKLWNGDVVRGTGRPFLEIPGGDHALFVPGPLRRSAEVLGDVATAIEEFLDALPG